MDSYKLIDFDYIELTNRERSLICDCVFMIGNRYMITHNSIEYAITVLTERIRSDLDSSYALAAMGYNNRFDRSSECQKLIKNLSRYKTTKK